MPRTYAGTDRPRLSAAKVDELVSRTTKGGTQDFDRWVKRISTKTLPNWTELHSQKLFIQVGDAMILGTPVGDARYWLSDPPEGYSGGRARGSWQPSIDNPETEDPDRIDKTGKIPQQEGLAVADDFKIGHSAFWTSNVPYILRLVHGWSRQAPNGWVPRAVRRVANQFRV